MAASTFDEWMNELDEPQAETARGLRALVHAAAPELEETIKWNQPTFTGKKPVIYLAAHAQHINFGFYEGAELQDPHQLLAGTGKKMRHVKVFRMEDVPSEALKQLVQEAVSHDRSA
jgi:hypothetical protein